MEIINYAASPQFEVVKVGKVLQSEKRAAQGDAICRAHTGSSATSHQQASLLIGK